MIGFDEIILLDTGVLLHLFRRDPFGHRIENAYEVWKRIEQPLISTVTLGEILAFANRNSYGAEKRAKLNAVIAEIIVVDIRRPMAERFAEIQASQQAIGKPIGENDTWIAATAMITGATLLTADRDFAKLRPGLIKLEIVEAI